MGTSNCGVKSQDLTRTRIHSLILFYVNLLDKQIDRYTTWPSARGRYVLCHFVILLLLTLDDWSEKGTNRMRTLERETQRSAGRTQIRDAFRANQEHTELLIKWKKKVLKEFRKSLANKRYRMAIINKGNA